MIGGTFEPGEPTRLAVAPRDEFEREWVERAKGGERLIAIDTYHDGRQRWLVGLYEKGSGNALRVGERLGSFEARKAEYDARGYHLVDICVYNEGGEMRVCGVWTEKGPASRIFRAQSWNELVDRIDIATANDWHIAAIDTWSPAEDA
nr:hypothetical protein [Aurantimonas endophytica]